MVTKKQIANGTAEFIEEMMNDIQDRQLKFVLSVTKDSLKKNPDMIDSFLDNSFVSSVVEEENGEYDISHFASAMKSVIAQCGAYPVVIPSVPLIMPEEKSIKISTSGIDSLVQHITRYGSDEDDD